MLKSISLVKQIVNKGTRHVQAMRRSITTCIERKRLSPLHALTPDPKTKDTKYYVKHIKRAVLNKEVRNIALSGDYGTGKSSIVAGFRRTYFAKIHKTKVISLLTLPNDLGDAKTNEEAKLKIRQKVQQEIFRQMYYGERPQTLNASRYKRIGGLPVYAIMVLFLPFIFLLYQAIDMCSPETLGFGNEYPYWAGITISLFAALILYLISAGVFRAIQRSKIKGLGINGMSVNLDEMSPTFEQAIDEIIYFFKKTRYQIIFLEDLDRFDDPKIYEELRQLNFMINNAKHVHHRHGVTFIYALKDSLVEECEIRAKLFDIIIPVVPFMTQDNAAYKIREVFTSANFTSQKVNEMIRILAHYIHDIRTIKAICNTAIIMRDTVSVKSTKLEEIIAIAAIRELYPQEYEAMRKGNSQLDEVYRNYLTRRQAMINEIATMLRKRKNIPNSMLAGAGQDLWGIISQDLKSDSNYIFASAQRGDENFDETSCSDIILWQQLVRGQTIEVNITYKHRHYTYYSNKEQTLSLNREIFTDSHNAAQELLGLLEHDVLYYEGQLDAASQTSLFSQLDDEDLNKLKDLPVLRESIETGIIDEQYRLYLSPFSEVAESLQLRNFRLLCLAQHSPSYNFYLSDNDIETLLNGANVIDLRSPAFLNHNIIAWMAKRQDNRLRIVLGENRTPPALLFNFYGNEYLLYQDELNQNYGDTIDGNLLQKGVLWSYVNEDEYMLYLTQVIAELHPLDLLVCLSTADWLRDDVAHEVLFDVAVLSLLNPSKVIITDDNRVKVASFLDYYEDTILLNGGSDKLAKLRIANASPTKNIGLYSKEAREALITSSMFVVNEGSISIVQPSAIIQKFENVGAADIDIAQLLNYKNIDPMVIQYCVERPDLCSMIHADKTYREITSYIIKHNIKLAYEHIKPLIGKFPDEDIVKILLASDLGWAEYKDVLKRLQPPLCNIQENKRPLLPNNNLSNRLIDKLDTFDVISSGPKIEKDQLRLIMKGGS